MPELTCLSGLGSTLQHPLDEVTYGRRLALFGPQGDPLPLELRSSASAFGYV